MVRECTQSRLIEVALNEFGVHGLEGASTRRIAGQAGTVMSAITYHYGGKEGLYLAVADSIAEHMSESMTGPLERAAAVEDGDRIAARAALHEVLAAFADKMLSPVTDGISLFIVREQMRPSAAFDRLYSALIEKLSLATVRLICISTGIADEHRARLVAVSLTGQVIVLRSSHASILRLFDRAEIDPALGEEIKAMISANLDAILDRLIAQPEAAA